MKPTISTSPDRWSCTTAGIRPSSLEKSIAVASSRVPKFRTTKNPAYVRRGCVSRELGMLLPGASILACAQSGRTAIVAVMVVMRVVEDGGHLCGSADLEELVVCKTH